MLPRLPSAPAARPRGPTLLAGAASLALAAGLLTPVLLAPVPAAAQGYFIPGGQQRPAAAPAPRPAPRPQPRREAPAPVQVAPLQSAPEQGPGPAADAGPPVQLPQPPVPELPPLPHGAAPPAAVIGVLGVPDIMQASTAAQLVQKTIGERRDKLNQDAQREQATWNSMQQSLKNDAPKLTPDQIRARERELQERITNAQRQFRDRGRIIQEATQVSLGQIERTLIAVIRQVAESRGMNLVLHRNQVALNINEFDISKAVADQLNKVLPSVQVPADGVDPAIVAQAGPRGAAPGTPAAAVPASAPAAGAPGQPAH